MSTPRTEPKRIEGSEIEMYHGATPAAEPVML
jgi:hypothetical protein